MKISEVIKNLEEIASKYGDIECAVRSYDGEYYRSDDVTKVYFTSYDGEFERCTISDEQ